MITQLRARGRWAIFSLAISLIAGSLCIDAASAVDGLSIVLTAEFNQNVTEGRLSPFRIALSGGALPIEGRLLIEQTVGNGWRGESLVVHEVAHGRLGEGDYRVVLPIYEGPLPLTVRVAATDGRIVAERTFMHQMLSHADPFAALVSVPNLGLTSAASVDAESLPDVWWAYDGVASLWIAEPLSRAAWTAVARWVRAGGSLVLFSGSLFHRLDGPIVRELLPLDDAHVLLDPTDQHPPWLAGLVRDGALVLSERNSLPLVLQRPFGAGRVTLVSVAPADLLPQEASTLLALVPEAITQHALASLAEEQLGQSTVVSPRYTVLAVVVLALLIVVSLFYGLQERRPQLASVVLVLGVASLAVFFGFYSNSTIQKAYIYQYSCELSVDTPFGFTWFSTALHSQITDRATIPWPSVRSVPIQQLPLTGSLAHSGSEVSAASVSIDLTPGRIQRLESFDAPGSHITFAYAAAAHRLRVDNPESETYEMAWLLSRDRLMRLGPIPEGSSEHDIRPSQLVDDIAGELASRSRPIAELFVILQESISLEDETWLLVARTRSGSDPAAGLAQWTHVVLRAIPGGGNVLQT